MKEDPQSFSSRVRTLPAGNLILAEDVEPVTDAITLPPGTPLLMERYSRWVDVHLIGSDNVTLRVLLNRSSHASVERVPINKIAIRKRTIDDAKTEAGKKAFASNIQGHENSVVSSPRKRRAMGSGIGSRRTGFDQGDFDETPKKPALDEVTAQQSLERLWTDRTGKFKIKASLVESASDKITLERDDGKRIQIAIANLSDSDQEFLYNRNEQDANPFKELEEPKSDASEMSSRPSSSLNSGSQRSGSQRSAITDATYRSPLSVLTQVTDLTWGAKSVAISPDNQFLMIGRKAACASLCDLKTGEVLVDSGRMNHMGDISVCGFTPDGKYVVLGGHRGLVEVYEINARGQMKRKTQFSQHTKEITALAFSLDSKYAMTGSAEKEAHYWELESGRPIATLTDFDGKIKACHISRSGDRVMATDGAILQVLQVAKAKDARIVPLGKSWASGQAAAFSPDGLLLATGDGHNVHLWNLKSFTKLPLMKGSAIQWSMVFTPDNRHLLAGENGVIHIWDAKTQRRVSSQPIGKNFYVQALAISTDGRLIASPSDHNSVVVLEATK